MPSTSNAGPSESEGESSRRPVEQISTAEGVQEPLRMEISPPKKGASEKDVTWMSLPHKGQLAILTLARLSEPLVQSSIRSYIYYQLKSFDTSLSDSVIASQAGVMQGGFAAAQLCTAILWGRLADSDLGGRKRVLLIGLSGTALSCIGFGFSTSFWQALFFRMLGGALNGNVGVMRTMVSEIVREKKYQSRAFLLLPMCGNIGVILGPTLGGILADPAGTHPKWFGNVGWLLKFPYAPPNITSAVILGCAFLSVLFGLEETLESLSDKDDFGINCRRKIGAIFRRLRSRGSKSDLGDYSRVAGADESQSFLQDSERTRSEDVEMSPVSAPPKKKSAPRYKQKLPFRRIFTYNVVCTLIAHALLAFSMGTFNNIFFIFLATPVYDPTNSNNSQPASYQPKPPFIFTGGAGLQPSRLGLAMSAIGFLGVIMQLFLYPIVNARIGTILSWRIFLYAFPVLYIISPFLALVPSNTPPPGEKSGPLFWLALLGVLMLQVIARTFAVPATAILINNCSPHPSVLGTIHGMGQSASSGARTIGPSLGGWLLGVALNHGVVGAVFWGLAGMASLTCVASNWVKEGNGHEIRLEGDDEAEAEAEAKNGNGNGREG